MAIFCVNIADGIPMDFYYIFVGVGNFYNGDVEVNFEIKQRSISRKDFSLSVIPI